MTNSILSWLERRKSAKRVQAERTGDSPEKLAEPRTRGSDVKHAASGAAVRGTAATPPNVGGMGGGGL